MENNLNGKIEQHGIISITGNPIPLTYPIKFPELPSINCNITRIDEVYPNGCVSIYMATLSGCKFQIIVSEDYCTGVNCYCTWNAKL